MSTSFGIDLVFRSQGGGKIRELSNQLQGIERGGRGAQQTLDGTSRSMRNVNTAASSAVGAVGRLAAAFGGLALAQKGLQAGIGRIESERRIQFLAKGYGEAKQLADAASVAARKFGVSQTEANEALATTYARLRPIGTSLSDIKSIYSGFSTAARISGASAAEASNAFTQLAQGLGSGALRGDEFNSIAEQVPGILTAISRETGVSQGKLRDFAAEGGITADIVIRALKRIEREGAGQLKEALDGPAQKIKDFQNAAEDLGAALAKELLPALTPLVRQTTELIKGFASLPKPVLSALGQIVLFTAKMWLLHKAITAMIGLRAGIAAMFASTAAGATAAGTAAGTATPMIRAMAAALRSLAAIGIVTVGVEYIVNGFQQGQAYKGLNNKVKAGGTGALIASGGKNQSREAVLQKQEIARATIKAAEAELARLKSAPAKSSLLGGNVGRGAVTTTDRGALLQSRIQDAKTVLALDANKFKTQSELIQQGFNNITNPDAGGTSGGGGGSTGDDLAKKLQE